MDDLRLWNEPQKSRARWEVGQTLLQQLPPQLSGPYAMAVRLAPLVVLAESDPWRFLLHENGNLTAAAVKLAVYWSKRQACFGMERAFLPMTMPMPMPTMNGSTCTGPTGTALDSADMAALHSPSFCLQRIPNDSHGQAVYTINTATIGSCLNNAGAGIRALFYQLHLAVLANHNASNNDTMGRVVFVLIAAASQQENINNTSFLAELETFFRILQELACQTLPLRVTRVYIVSPPPTLTTTTRTNLPSPIILHLTLQAMAQNSLMTQAVIIQLRPPPPLVVESTSSNSSHHPQEGLVRELESFGFTRQGLPCELGGTFGASDIPTSMSPAAAVATVSSAKGKQQELKQSKAVTSEIKNKRKASACAGACRSELHIPVIHNDKKNTSTNNEEHEEHEEEESEEIRLKKRNALYSRRKYARKKIEIEVMKKQVNFFKEQHAILRKEHERLEALKQQSAKCVEEHHCEKKNSGSSSGVGGSDNVPTRQQQQQQTVTMPQCESSSAHHAISILQEAAASVLTNTTNTDDNHQPISSSARSTTF